MKTIKAVKCADSWHVELIRTFCLTTEQGVEEFIREEGLEITYRNESKIVAYPPLKHKRQSGK